MRKHSLLLLPVLLSDFYGQNVTHVCGMGQLCSQLTSDENGTKQKERHSTYIPNFVRKESNKQQIFVHDDHSFTHSSSINLLSITEARQ